MTTSDAGTPPRPARRYWVGVAAALAVLALLTLSEAWAARERVPPGAGPVERDVAAAREATAQRLLALERQCSETAAEALRRTEDTTDRAALFAALGSVPLPPGAGLHVEDRDGRMLAWAGETVDDQVFAHMPRGTDGTLLVETLSSRRLAVRRGRASPVVGMPVLAVCHRPFEISYPLRNRFLPATSLASDVRRSFRVASVRVLPPGSADGEPVRSAFGGELARIAVEPLEARSWNEAADAAARSRRAALIASLVLVLAVWIFREAPGATRPRDASGARAAWLRALTILLARAALALVPLESFLPEGPLTDPTRYAHGLGLDLAGSPLDLLLTAAAVLGAAACVRRAACAARSPAFAGAAAGLAAVAATALVVGRGLAWLVTDVVRNSTVEFFAEETVLPYAASAALVASLLLCGVGAILVLDGAWRWSGPRAPRTRLCVAAAALAGLLATPLGPAARSFDGGSGALDALHLVGVVAMAAAAAASFLELGAAARAAAVPLALSIALFPALERELGAATRETVERHARERVEARYTSDRLVVEQVLEDAVELPLLEDAIERAQAQAGRLPPNLAVRVWSRSRLASREGGSGVEIVPLLGAGRPDAFRDDLPPDEWLPAPESWPGPERRITAEPLPGRGPGADGRYFVGESEVRLAGRPAAMLRVIAEVRAPTNAALPDLEILGPAHPEDTLEPPPLALTRYAADGRLVETNDPHRPAGAPLRADLAERVLGEGRPAWLTLRVAGGELAVLVLPETAEDAVVGAYAFSFETGGTRALLLRITKMALCGALLSLFAIAASARAWVRRWRESLGHRLVLSYVLVSAVPLLVLAWVNRELVRERAEDDAERELREAVVLVTVALQELREESLLEIEPYYAGKRMLELAYAVGHHANVFRGSEIWASADQGLYDTELLPRRLPGPVFRDVVLVGQPFRMERASVGDVTFDVGYGPLRSREDGEVVGAVSVPLLHRQQRLEEDVANGVTAVLGFYLASLVAAMAAGSWMAGRLASPLRRLTVATRRVAAGDLSSPVPGAGPGELGEVVRSFNRMMSELAESRERLVRAEKEAAWRDMARQVAHEVKNPLTPMRLAAEHLRRAWRDGASDFGAVLERGVDVIVRQTESLKRIATAFSDFARLPVRRREPVDLGRLVEEVLALYANTPNLTIRRELGPAPPVSADPDELRRVLINLAANAVEALAGRPGTLDARLAPGDGHVVLSLRDDGPGIPPEVVPRLFEPSFSTKTSGTGLGLAICKRAIEDHGGTIALTSAPGEGTTVTVRLPAASAPGPGGDAGRAAGSTSNSP